MLSVASQGAATAAPTRPPFDRTATTRRRVGDFPYLPAYGTGRCDLCGDPTERLSRVVLEEGRIVEHDGRKLVRAARVAFCCVRHRGETTVGTPVTPPRLQTARGTSQLHPQTEALFDSTALKVGGGSR